MERDKLGNQKGKNHAYVIEKKITSSHSSWLYAIVNVKYS